MYKHTKHEWKRTNVKYELLYRTSTSSNVSKHVGAVYQKEYRFQNLEIGQLYPIFNIMLRLTIENITYGAIALKYVLLRISLFAIYIAETI